MLDTKQFEHGKKIYVVEDGKVKQQIITCKAKNLLDMIY